MRINPDLTNGKAATVTSCDGLNFVSMTLSPSPGKDRDHDLLHDHGARRKAR